MAAQQSLNINLLRTQSTLTNEELLILHRLQFISYSMAIVAVVVGLFVGTAYVAAQLRLKSLEDEQTSVLRQIASNAEKEVMLLALKDRIPIIDKTIAAQFPWENILSSLAAIVTPPNLKTITIDSSNVLRFVVTADTLEQVEEITERIITLTHNKRVRKPVIESLQVIEDEAVEVTFQVTPVF